MDYKINRWFVLLSGFTQTPKTLHGLHKLSMDIHERVAGPGTRVELRTWRNHHATLAEKMKLTSTRHPEINIVGYSFGGHAALKLCQHLANRNLTVKHLCLVDAVKGGGNSMWTARFMNSVWPWAKLEVPENVREVESFRQEKDWPSGHEIVANNKHTVLHETKILDLPHVEMDDAQEVRDLILSRL